MIDLADNALFDAEQVLLYLGETDPNNEHINIDHIRLMINAVASDIEGHCQRLFMAATDLAEDFDGDGTCDYYPTNYPLTACSAIKYWDGDSWEEMSSTTYPRTVDTTHMRVYFNDGYRFGSSTRYQVTYSYGWALNEAPAAMLGAYATLVQRKIMRTSKGMEGLKNRLSGTTTESFDLTIAMPQAVINALQQFKRITL